MSADCGSTEPADGEADGMKLSGELYDSVSEACKENRLQLREGKVELI